jgi:cellobiose phosphorylase
MRYGHFDDKNREYEITRVDTPLPWINYLGCNDFFSLISNTAGGYSFYKDARLRRLTRYRYNNAPLDTGGRFIYLRDNGSENVGSRVNFWSPTGQPVRSTSLDFYECRHGLGYTTIKSSKYGIQVDLRFFVPMNENLEIWELNVRNLRDQPAELSVFGAVEFCLWDAWDDATNFQRNLSLAEVEIESGVIYHKTEYRERRNHFAYFACSHPTLGFDTQREAFLGPYRGWADPAGVERGTLSNSIARGWQPVGVQHIGLSLEAGTAQKIIFMLGYFENPQDDKFDGPDSQLINKSYLAPTIHRFRQASQVEAEFEDLRSSWGEFLGTLQVDTPDEHTNRMVNIWNPYQVMATFNLSRSASYFESGVSRGIGFRDSNQDLLAFVQFDRQRSRGRLLELAATQLRDGGAYHQFQPLTKRGNDLIGSGFNDDPLWLVLSVAAYLRETGDWDILGEMVPYSNESGTEETLYNHLQRSIEYTLARLGPHGLPLIGRADWNDCLNLNCHSVMPGQSFQAAPNVDGRVAESLFIPGLFILAVHEMIAFARHNGEKEEIGKLEEAVSRMEAAVWAAGWDGGWFRRAYDDGGQPVGSSSCDEGQIFIEPQGVNIMAGLGLGDGRARQALEAVWERLATPHGIVLHQPAYTRYYPELGEISSYPPGYKENAGIFCHSNPWIMIAETLMGNGDRAFDYYLRINPSARENISEIHRCEPYVYAQMIAGSDAPTHGEAKNSWLTGTAAWNYVAITQNILGIRPTLHGLCIAPVIPSTWEGFTAARIYRGVRYEIEVKRRGKGNAVELIADGQILEGNTVPVPQQDGKVVKVLAWIG